MTLRGRWAACVVVVLACVAAGLVDSTPAVAAGEAGRQAGSHQGRVAHAAPVRRAAARAVRLDPAALGPGAPRAGTRARGLRLRARPARTGPSGTVVPHEGGPGYSTTSTASYYAPMYGPLLDRRNLLLVDQRGTGRSEAMNCPALQDLKIAYNVAAGRCGRSLGARADDYTDRTLGRRPRRGHLQARARPGRPLRRLLRHLLHRGVHRPPPRPGAQPRPRRRLPDVRRVRVVPDPGAGDAALPSTSPVRARAACRAGGPVVPAALRPSCRRCASTRGAGSRTTPTVGAPT